MIANFLDCLVTIKEPYSGTTVSLVERKKVYYNAPNKYKSNNCEVTSNIDWYDDKGGTVIADSNKRILAKVKSTDTAYIAIPSDGILYIGTNRIIVDGLPMGSYESKYDDIIGYYRIFTVPKNTEELVISGEYE